MRTIRIITLPICLAMLVLLASGCSQKNRSTTAEAASEENIVTFNVKSGLLIPPETAKFIGLKIADVEEQEINSALEFSAQVYRSASESRYASLHPVVSTGAHASGSLSARQAALLHEGQTVTVKTEGVDSLAARIEAINRDASQTNAPVEVLVVITDTQARLHKGAFVSVTVPLKGDKSVVAVPIAALLRTAEGDFVYTVSGDRFVRASVKLGTLNPEWAEIADGLYAGDQIVVNPVMTLWMAELQSLRGGKACADGH